MINVKRRNNLKKILLVITGIFLIKFVSLENFIRSKEKSKEDKSIYSDKGELMVSIT